MPDAALYSRRLNGISISLTLLSKPEYINAYTSLQCNNGNAVATQADSARDFLHLEMVWTKL